MKSDILSEILRLRELYECGTPEIEDSEYDSLVKEYVEVHSGSYIDIYGNSLLNLKYPMMSQQNIYNLDDLQRFLDGFEKDSLFAITPKFDGVSICFVFSSFNECSVFSRHGKLLSKDVQEILIKRGMVMLQDIQSVGHSIQYPFFIRCEAIMSKNNFNKYSGSYKNPRNMVAGLLNQKSPSKFQPYADMDLIPFDVSMTIDYLEILNLSGITRMLAKSGTPVDDTELTKFYDAISEEYFCDGLVFRMNDTSQRNLRGNTGHHWNAECALKNQNKDIQETIIKEVEWNMSDTGKYTPVAILEPVNFKDATVSRVILNSVNFIQTMGIKIGSKVKIIKSGDIIPKILSSDHQGTDIVLEDCIHCKSFLEQIGATMFCTNPDCIEKTIIRGIKQINRVQEFLELKGISEQTVRKAFPKFFLGNEEHEANSPLFEFLFRENLDLGKAMEEKRVELRKALMKSKIEFGTLLYLLAVPSIGSETRDAINDFVANGYKKPQDSIMFWKSVIFNFLNTSGKTTEPIKKSLGEFMSMSASYWQWISRNLYIPEYSSENLNLPKYIFTGNPDNMTKNQFKQMMDKKALQVSTVIKADYVICNDPGKKSKKYQDGIKLGKKVLTQKEFLDEMREKWNMTV